MEASGPSHDQILVKAGAHQHNFSQVETHTVICSCIDLFRQTGQQQTGHLRQIMPDTNKPFLSPNYLFCQYCRSFIFYQQINLGPSRTLNPIAVTCGSIGWLYFAQSSEILQILLHFIPPTDQEPVIFIFEKKFFFYQKRCPQKGLLQNLNTV